MSLKKYAVRLERAWNILRVQGVRRFTAAGTGFVRSRLGRPSSVQANYLENKERADSKFDAEAGVVTGGIQYLHDLTIDSDNARFGNNHIAIDPAEFEQAMASVDIDLQSAIFVDFGSGMGRALIMAAGYPFRQIIGVEFARELHEVCVVNLQRVFPTSSEDDRITAILGDAADFEYPAQPLVLYLFNPFDAPVMAAVARNAFASWQANPRPIRVVYLNPVFAREWTNAGWVLLEEGIGRVIFGPPSR